MVLIECPECNKEISSSAISCPSCGYPFQNQSSEPKFEAYQKRKLIVGLILCIVWLPICIILKQPVFCAIFTVCMVVVIARLVRLHRKE
jgi:hypothetical protein